MNSGEITQCFAFFADPQQRFGPPEMECFAVIVVIVIVAKIQPFTKIIGGCLVFAQGESINASVEKEVGFLGVNADCLREVSGGLNVIAITAVQVSA